jgi:hypothetical protein
MALPFQLPLSDSKCLASGSGWNLTHTFHIFIWLPVIVFLYIFDKARVLPPASPERLKYSSTLIFLMTLWYSPVLQTVATIFDCVQNLEGLAVLSSDPNISCKPSFLRNAMKAEAVAVIVFVGVGFPLFICARTLHLKNIK